MEANLDFRKVKQLALSLQKLVKAGYQVSIVVGAGNIFRARMVKGMSIDRVAADHMGMIATTINALALQSMLEKLGQSAKVLSALPLSNIMEEFSYTRAMYHLSKKRVVIFAGGTGNPYFTTDTALVLRALEIGADKIYKATNVKGVYSADPEKNKKAKFYDKLSYQQALDQKLKVMDSTAFALANDNNLLLTVFKYSPANIVSVVKGEKLGTKVSNESS